MPHDIPWRTEYFAFIDLQGVLWIFTISLGTIIGTGTAVILISVLPPDLFVIFPRIIEFVLLEIGGSFEVSVALLDVPASSV